MKSAASSAVKWNKYWQRAFEGNVRTLAVLAMGMLVSPIVSTAATLIVAGGEIIGATGVVVGDNGYDVEFVDGSCIELFNGCDDVSDFTFVDRGSARTAAQALLDQVFIDTPMGLFDSSPWLTKGCEFDTRFRFCYALTPFEVRSNQASASDSVVLNSMAVNVTGVSSDYVYFQGFSTDHDHAAPYEVYARWSNPAVIEAFEPGTLALFALGLAGLALSRRHGRAESIPRV